MTHAPESNEAEKLVTEVRCPNCDSASIRLQLLEGKRVPSKLRSSPHLILGIVMLLISVCSIFAGIGMSSFGPAAFWIYATPGFLCLIPGIVGIVRYVQSSRVRQFRCSECGHYWDPTCPSCGKPENVWQPLRINRVSGKQVGWFYHLVGGGLFTIVGIFLIIFFSVNYLVAIQTGTSPVYYVLVGVMFLSGGIPVLLGYYKASKASQFKCASCGIKWIWSETPITPIEN